MKVYESRFILKQISVRGKNGNGEAKIIKNKV